MVGKMWTSTKKKSVIFAVFFLRACKKKKKTDFSFYPKQRIWCFHWTLTGIIPNTFELFKEEEHARGSVTGISLRRPWFGTKPSNAKCSVSLEPQGVVSLKNLRSSFGKVWRRRVGGGAIFHSAASMRALLFELKFYRASSPHSIASLPPKKETGITASVPGSSSPNFFFFFPQLRQEAGGRRGGGRGKAEKKSSVCVKSCLRTARKEPPGFILLRSLDVTQTRPAQL